jgi:L-cysteine:1D-myo-inositol 2-amino-2-deoxy-alpha-D-glucopyranoside ligase
VECAAIATEYLGDRFDVQAGGTDLIFPHHEMSASHARVALGDGGAAPEVFARCYAHAGMVRLAGEKMSKSLGNLVFVSSLLAGGADPVAVRLAILAHSYRDDWDWTEPGLSAAADRLARWRAAVSSCLAAPASGESGPVPTGPVPTGPAASGPVPSGESVLAGVRERLADDLDAVGALAVIDRWAGAVASATSLPADAAAAAALVRDTADALLGIAL